MGLGSLVVAGGEGMDGKASECAFDRANGCRSESTDSALLYIHRSNISWGTVSARPSLYVTASSHALSILVDLLSCLNLLTGPHSWLSI